METAKRKYVQYWRIAWIRVFEHELEDQIEQMDLMDSLVAREYRRFDKWAGQRLSEMPKHSASDAASDYAKDSQDLSERYPRLQRYNALVMIWSIFEKTVVDLWRRESKTMDTNVRLSRKDRLKFKFVYNVIDELKKRGMAIPTFYTEVQNYADIRNQLVHDFGERDGSKRSLDVDSYVERRLESGKTGLEFRGGILHVTPDFCREMAETLQLFFRTFVNGLPDHAPPRGAAAQSEDDGEW